MKFLIITFLISLFGITHITGQRSVNRMLFDLSNVDRVPNMERRTGFDLTPVRSNNGPSPAKFWWNL